MLVYIHRLVCHPFASKGKRPGLICYRPVGFRQPPFSSGDEKRTNRLTQRNDKKTEPE
ncbi:hypothetical protein HMPREF1555_01612 [Porphyromonas gingivalis F0570]|uniref:Uncharacterized protein n=1 Tax=Porphyromonas gingivalis F0570 TaxID=1227271 RepID=A0A0E2M498_PORGN|nr:hypothetical protein HMPREF1555_01612 [Porphyromonas gingivalis F0570]